MQTQRRSRSCCVRPNEIRSPRLSIERCGSYHAELRIESDLTVHVGQSHHENPVREASFGPLSPSSPITSNWFCPQHLILLACWMAVLMLRALWRICVPKEFSSELPMARAFTLPNKESYRAKKVKTLRQRSRMTMLPPRRIRKARGSL